MKTSDKWHWMSDSFPAMKLVFVQLHKKMSSLLIKPSQRNESYWGNGSFQCDDVLHEEAIYMHQGIQFQVEKLDWEEKKAYVTEVDVDYFTDANLAVELKVMSEDERKQFEITKSCYTEISLF